MTTPPYRLVADEAITLTDLVTVAEYSKPDEEDQAARNLVAAGHAARGVLAAHSNDDEPATLVLDLLIDLHHLCDVIDADLDGLVESAYDHYRAEIEGRI